MQYLNQQTQEVNKLDNFLPEYEEFESESLVPKDIRGKL